MRIKNFAVISLMAVALAGCNDTLDSGIDLATVKNKVEQPLPSRIIEQMKAKGMERNSPIMVRIFKEEGTLEIWKAKTNNRFDKIAGYKICAWSGRLGPKVKEGDRQAPEGFYPLSPHHLNPNSSYYLAINTGFPNRYDQANGRNGTNLMIHGACSSSGCYSMTDEQVLEIYAFARDAFKGGQQAVQLQAFPFRMTAENMARHRNSPHIEFWNMLKVGYDHFEVTKRPPEVNVCEKKYVFNQQVEGSASFSASAQCPSMSTPAALQGALASYEKTYDRDYEKAMKKYDGMAWYEPSEAERKALVKDQRKGRELAYAPTGSSLDAGKLMKMEEYEQALSKRDAKPAVSADGAPATATASAQQPKATETVAPQVNAPASVAAATPAAGAPDQQAGAPIPTPSPNAPSAVAAAAPEPAAKKTFWKLFSRPDDAQPEATAAAPAAQMPTTEQPTAPQVSAAPTAKPAGEQAVVPVPSPNPNEAAPEPVATAEAAPKKPIWKFWSKQ